MTSPLVSLGGRGASGERLRTLIGPTLWGGKWRESAFEFPFKRFLTYMLTSFLFSGQS